MRQRMIPWAGKALALVATLQFAGSCGSFGLYANTVQIRAENGSSLTFDKAILHTSEGPRTFGPLEPGEAGPFVQVREAYDIISASVVIGTETASLTVIDFVGEEPLEPGRYTYVLDVVPGSGPQAFSLVQTLRVD